MSNSFPHGIDITAPGGVAKLMDFHRLTFGDAVMEDGADAAAAAAAQAASDAKALEDAAAAKAAADKADAAMDTDGGKRALQAERDARAAAEKRAADAEAKIQAAEDAKLSDIQLANKKATDAEERAAKLETANARLAALAKYPVPEKYQHLVNGTDAASFEASAKDVSELAGVQGKKRDPIHDSGDKSGDRGGAGTSVSAGRDLYASKHTKKS
ncbi:hypothetical protein SRABI26_02720 [Arthrobacter sp. Bi26]|uniref:hypothetical protein n=1 Tax=Arthrobacter sp. Bi26 TaxID=2822350 RepID=UPI001E18551B|nr:hypothetical protein [Arthrobacter sp. Bi26]CAH0233808.1 hypothetical protein SRABI26_02720 [Arthrobacter sp. Bi26]